MRLNDRLMCKCKKFHLWMVSGVTGLTRDQAGISLSIIIPCFNAAATIGAAIESMLSQGNIKPEIVIINDGSNDRSAEVARSFEPRVRVLTGLNRGVSAARNRGIAETTSERIVFLDADDLLLAETLRLSARLRMPPEVAPG